MKILAMKDATVNAKDVNHNVQALVKADVKMDAEFLVQLLMER